MKSIIKPIIFLILLGILGVVGYTMFFGDKKQSGSSDTLISVTTGAAPSQSSTITEQTSEDIGQQFVALLLSIQSITLTDTLFSDPAFVALEDYSVSIVQPGNEGRKNPFAPIGGQEIQITPSQTSNTGPLAP